MKNLTGMKSNWQKEPIVTIDSSAFHLDFICLLMGICCGLLWVSSNAFFIASHHQFRNMSTRELQVFQLRLWTCHANMRLSQWPKLPSLSFFCVACAFIILYIKNWNSKFFLLSRPANFSECCTWTPTNIYNFHRVMQFSDSFFRSVKCSVAQAIKQEIAIFSVKYQVKSLKPALFDQFKKHNWITIWCYTDILTIAAELPRFWNEKI